MDQIKSYEELLSKPDQHIAFFKEASEKLDKAERKLLIAAAEKEKLLANSEKQRLDAAAKK
jgi:hypothetical protein